MSAVACRLSPVACRLPSFLRNSYALFYRGIEILTVVKVVQEAHILCIKWNFVRGSFVRWCPPFFVPTYSTVVQIYCTCADVQ